MGSIIAALFGSSKKKNENSIAIDQSLASRIPYTKCYEDEGIMETIPGNFTKTYIIGDLDQKAAQSSSVVTARQTLALLMNDFPVNVSFQFTTHNMLISQENYLKQVLMIPNKGEPLDGYINEYNAVISDNVDVGHNNIKKTTYFTVSIKTAFVDDAITLFRDLDAKIKERFKSIYNIEVKGLNLMARLRVLYNMYNPGVGDFGKKIDLKGDGNIELKNMRYMHLTTKDVIAPENMNSNLNLKDHIILNEGTDHEIYARVFGITNIPREVSDNVIADLTNVSSSMVYSSIYEQIDTELGYETSKELVVKNTITETRMKRSTVAERKAHASVQIKERINSTEKDYFNEQALDLFQTNVAGTQKTFAVTFVVCLYAPSMEDLERDSELLKLSADKFAFKLKSLDVQQLQGFQTMLPLCSNRLDLRRVIDIDRLVRMSPVHIQDVIRRGGVYNGLNAINDNLVLLNRKNSSNLSGIIAGVEHSGKTYQCKKEIFNALISTDDDVSVVTFTDEYDDFCKKLGGNVIEGMKVNIFDMAKGYGLMDRNNNPEKDIIFKSYFLDALFVSMQDYKATTKLFLKEDAGSSDAVQNDIDAIETEVAALIQYIDRNGLGTEDEDKIFDYIRDNIKDFPMLLSCLLKMDSRYLGGHFINRLDELGSAFRKMVESYDAPAPENMGRLTLYKVKNKTDMLTVLDFLRNKAVRDLQRKDGRHPFNWIFVDPIDRLLEDTAASDYLSEYLYKSNLVKTVVTMVVQDSVRLISGQVTQLAFEDLVNGCGYFKLMSQGPIERRKYIELLSIPQALTQYISNVEPGKGVIITSSTNVAFDDSFLEPDNKYHLLFAKEIEQVVLNEKLQKRGA